MRVSTSMMQSMAVNSMLSRQAELSKTQQQVASGLRVLTPSDDPAAATQIIRFEQEVKVTEQFQRNADRAVSRLTMEEGVLSSVGNALQRVRELAVQGLNDTNSPEDRNIIAKEVRERLGEIMQLANTRDASGEYLFAGYRGQTEPFSDAGGGVYNYDGDQGQRHLQISASRSVATSDSGHDVFVNLSHSGGGTQNMLKTVYDFAIALEADSPDGNVLTDLDAALDRVFETRASIGGRINTIDAQGDINAQYLVQLQSDLSDIQDLDYAEAIGRMELQLTGLQAAQASFEKVQNLSLFNFLR